MKKKKNKPPLVLGLTGSIGMGKSTATRILKSFGLPVYNADSTVHELLKRKGEAFGKVAKLFPESLKQGAINRSALGKIVFEDKKKLDKLEKILHPLVTKHEQNFIKEMKRKKAKAVVLEIPLLFETKAEKRCDAIICVTAPKAIQKQRVLKRKGMTEAKLKRILNRQLSDKIKRQRADYIISTGISVADTKRQLKALWEKIMKEE